MHITWKIQVHTEYKQRCRDWYRDRVGWEFAMVRKAMGIKGVVWPKGLVQEGEVTKLANPRNLIYNRNNSVFSCREAFFKYIIANLLGSPIWWLWSLGKNLNFEKNSVHHCRYLRDFWVWQRYVNALYRYDWCGIIRPPIGLSESSSSSFSLSLFQFFF